MLLELGGHRIDAHSEGGIDTCYEIPEFDVCLDIGRCRPGVERRGTLLLSHAHIDHAGGLPYWVSLRALMRMSKPRVFCPIESRDALEKILALWATLDADSDKCTLTGVRAGDIIPLENSAYAKVFRGSHRVADVGYTIYRERRRLKRELVGLSPSEIAAMSTRGTEVGEIAARAEICFPGDTTIDVVESEPSVTEARVLLLECTFLGSHPSVEKARAGGHVHLDEIATRAHLFQNEHVVLTHFSKRYAPAEIEHEVRARLPRELLERTTLLIHDGRSP